MYQADFWIAWGLLLSESPNEFADHKENAVCLITELQSVPSPRPPPPPSHIPHQGFIVPFPSDVSISHSPVFAPLVSLSRAAALTFVSPAAASWSETLARVVLRSAFNCPPPLAAEREEMPHERGKRKHCRKAAQVLSFPKRSCR